MKFIETKLKGAWGIRWDDKAIGIKWPIKPTTISENDQSYKLL